MPPSRELVWRPDPVVVEGGAAGVDNYLSASAARRVRDGVPANTRRTYQRAWTRFVSWCAAEGRTHLPATAATLAEYVNHLCDLGYAPATIEQAIAVIRAAHHGSGHRDEPDTKPARLALNAYVAELADEGRGHQRQAPPVTIPALRAMISACDLETPIGLRDRLAMVLGLALMGRRSELVALHIGDVREVEEGLEVKIRRSKTDQAGRGETIAIPAGTHPLTNPVAALRDWLACLADHGITEGRLLRSVNRHGHIGDRLSANAVNAIVKKLAAAAELPDADRYSAHSLRAGGATVAYAAGVPVSTICKHGRWKEGSPVVLKYIRAVDVWRDNAMRNVGL